MVKGTITTPVTPSLLDVKQIKNISSSQDRSTIAYIVRLSGIFIIENIDSYGKHTHISLGMNAEGRSDIADNKVCEFGISTIDENTIGVLLRNRDLVAVSVTISAYRSLKPKVVYGDISTNIFKVDGSKMLKRGAYLAYIGQDEKEKFIPATTAFEFDVVGDGAITKSLYQNISISKVSGVYALDGGVLKRGTTTIDTDVVDFARYAFTKKNTIVTGRKYRYQSSSIAAAYTLGATANKAVFERIGANAFAAIGNSMSDGCGEYYASLSEDILPRCEWAGVGDLTPDYTNSAIANMNYRCFGSFKGVADGESHAVVVYLKADGSLKFYKESDASISNALVHKRDKAGYSGLFSHAELPIIFKDSSLALKGFGDKEIGECNIFFSKVS